MKTRMNVIRGLLLLGVGLMFCNCKNAVHVVDVNGCKLTVCDMDLVSDTIQLPLSQLVESCEMVKLDSHEDALFQGAWHTSVSENYILVNSYGRRPVKLFDRKGKFLRNIGTIGKGPGEYTSLYGIQLDEMNNRIYCTPFAHPEKILVYDLEGNALPPIPLAQKISGKIRCFVADGKITVIGMPFKNDQAIVFQQTLEGKLIQKVSPKTYMFAHNYDDEVFAFHNADAYEMFNTSIDTLFHYDTKQNTLAPRFVINLTEKKKPVHVLYELPHCYYAWVAKKGSVIVDKNTLEANYVKLQNDFFGKIDASLAGSFDGTFINNIPVFKLKENIKKAVKSNDLSEEMRAKLAKMDRELDPNDNNVVFIGKLIQ